MSIAYSGGAIVHQVFTTDGSQQDLINKLENYLNNAGWATISGHQSSPCLMESAATPNSNKIRIKFTAPGGSTAYISCNIQSTDGVRTSQDYPLGTAPPSNQFQITAGKFGGCIQHPGVYLNWPFVLFGTWFVPAFLTAQLSGDLGFMQCSETPQGWYRRCLRYNAGGSQYWSSIMGNNLTEGNTGGDEAGQQSLAYLASAHTWGNQTANYWHDQSMVISDPFLLQGFPGSGDTLRIRGQFYDCILLNGSWPANTVLNYDGHQWVVLGNNVWPCLAMLCG